MFDDSHDDFNANDNDTSASSVYFDYTETTESSNSSLSNEINTGGESGSNVQLTFLTEGQACEINKDCLIF